MFTVACTPISTLQGLGLSRAPRWRVRVGIALTGTRAARHTPRHTAGTHARESAGASAPACRCGW